MKLSNKLYDVLKWVAIILLPALATFYSGLTLIWEQLPYPIEIPRTITLVGTLLGMLLGISHIQYTDEQHKLLEEAKVINQQED